MARRRIQNEDVKEVGDLGGDPSLLTHDTKIYVTSLNKTIADAIADGDISASSPIFPGEIRAFHTYNGIFPIPRRFMKVNGNVVNEANYDAIHGAGAYVTDDIAASLILGRNLPNAEAKYLTGTANTAQTGLAPFTYVGNANNQVNLQHNHQWYDNDQDADDDSYNSSGNQVTIDGDLDGDEGSGIQFTTGEDGEYVLDNDYYTDNAGSTTQTIRPHSVEVIYIICVR
jgi:hypothetical protein